LLEMIDLFFPEDITHQDIGMLAPQGVLNVKVVE